MKVAKQKAFSGIIELSIIVTELCRVKLKWENADKNILEICMRITEILILLWSFSRLSIWFSLNGLWGGNWTNGIFHIFSICFLCWGSVDCLLSLFCTSYTLITFIYFLAYVVDLVVRCKIYMRFFFMFTVNTQSHYAGQCKH